MDNNPAENNSNMDDEDVDWYALFVAAKWQAMARFPNLSRANLVTYAATLCLRLMGRTEITQGAIAALFHFDENHETLTALLLEHSRQIYDQNGGLVCIQVATIMAVIDYFHAALGPASVDTGAIEIICSMVDFERRDEETVFAPAA